jgi:hypothetical protein
LRKLLDGGLIVIQNGVFGHEERRRLEVRLFKFILFEVGYEVNVRKSIRPMLIRKRIAQAVIA